MTIKRAIPDINVADPKIREPLEAMKEILEILLGRHGSSDDRALTRGDIDGRLLVGGDVDVDEVEALANIGATPVVTYVK